MSKLRSSTKYNPTLFTLLFSNDKMSQINHADSLCSELIVYSLQPSTSRYNHGLNFNQISMLPKWLDILYIALNHPRCNLEFSAWVDVVNMPMILWSINCHYSKQPNPRYNYTSQCVIITKSLTHSGVATQNWNASIKLQKMMYRSNIPQFTSRFRYYLHSIL